MDDAYRTDLLAEIRACRGQERRRRRSLCLWVVSATLRGHPHAIRQFRALWRVNAASLEHLRLAEAEVLGQVSYADGQTLTPGR